jgi:hypothetical protein
MAEGFIHTVQPSTPNRRRSRQAATSRRSAPRSTSSTTRTARSANATRTATTAHTGQAESPGVSVSSTPRTGNHPSVARATTEVGLR